MLFRSEIELRALPEDDLLALAVEQSDERLRPPFADGEVELEFLLRRPVRVPEDGDVGFEEPSGFFDRRISGGERPLGRRGYPKAEGRKDLCGLVYCECE